MSESRDNLNCPAFSAISYDGETIDSDLDLDALLGRLADDARAAKSREREELTIWRESEECVAVVKSDGTIIRTDGKETPQKVQEPRSGNGKTKRRP